MSMIKLPTTVGVQRSAHTIQYLTVSACGVLGVSMVHKIMFRSIAAGINMRRHQYMRKNCTDRII